jgi:hypothetical protein
MYKLVIIFFFIAAAYMVMRNVRVNHVPVRGETLKDMIQHPFQVLQDAVPSVSRLSDWLGLPLRRYTPNPYGYGGLDPSGGERKGGDGRGIPDAVEVGWWKGEEVTYPERRLSPVQDEASTPPEPRVADVGWWGDDWLA